MKRRTSRNLFLAWLTLAVLMIPLATIFRLVSIKFFPDYQIDTVHKGTLLAFFQYYLLLLAVLFPVLAAPQFFSFFAHVTGLWGAFPEAFEEWRRSRLRFILWDEFFEDGKGSDQRKGK
jgi:hypothetical protein